MWCNRSNGRQLHTAGEPVWILNLWMSVGEKSRHVIICSPRWRYSRDTGPCRHKQMRWCLRPKCLYENIIHHVPVICWSAVLLRTNRMSWNVLNPPKLSDNPIGYIGLYTIKSPPDLVSSHRV
ncbi:hypothetical protein M9H77_22222 [Catharanthus roseus]|uniref:Uncharacterized protein n=1 Tax=Catharanthus roseus TaxID=4058 RepID=A0ACC0AQS5_CATRO|nr:hypothetical protein M9H77_22222 [Catharanthus roseus]